MGYETASIILLLRKINSVIYTLFDYCNQIFLEVRYKEHLGSYF